MKNKIYIFLSFIIFVLTVIPFFVSQKSADSDTNISVELIDLDNKKSISSFGELIKTGNKEKKIRVGGYLDVIIFPDSSFRLNSIDRGELLQGSVILSSVHGFYLNVDNVNTKLSQSSLFAKINNNVTKLVGLYGISDIDFKYNQFRLSNNFGVTIKNDKDYPVRNLFDFLSQVGYKQIPVHNKTSVEFNTKFFNFEKLGNIQNVGKFTIFKNKNIDYDNNINIANFNTCSNFISNLYLTKTYSNEKEKGYTNIKKLCILKGFLRDQNLLSFFLKNIETISLNEFKYDILDLVAKFNRKNIEISKNTELLNNSIESNEYDFSYYLSNVIINQIKEESNLIKLTHLFFDIHSIINTNTTNIDKNLLILKWATEDRIFEISDNKDFLAKEFMKYHFNLSENLLAEQGYDLLEYTLDKRHFFNISKELPQITTIYNEFRYKSDVLSTAYEMTKEKMHASVTAGEKIYSGTESIDIIEKQKQREDEINDLIADLNKGQRRSANLFSTDEIIKIFDKYGFIVDKDNITPTIIGGDVFTITDVIFDNLKINLEFDYKSNAVFNVEDAVKKGTGKLSVGSFEKISASVPLKYLIKSIYGKYADKYINSFIDPAVVSVSGTQEFSYEDYLGKELIKKYLAYLNIFVNTNNITKQNGDTYFVNKAYVDGVNLEKIKFSFTIVLKEWTISNLHLTSDPGQKMIAESDFAKNISWIVKKTHTLVKNRTKNKQTLLQQLSALEIDNEDISIDELSEDGFVVKKEIFLESSVGSLPGTIEGIFDTEKNIFTYIILKFRNKFKSWNDITLSQLNSNISDFEELYNRELQQAKLREIEIEERRNAVDYSDIPDELINGDWIME